jgi:collagen type V/XI/XXIV/XXVII alpha
MRRKLAVILFAGLFALGAASPASAGQPPGQLGYEGQPGNQGGGGSSGPPPGCKGYEGQPGNQGNGTLGYEGQPGNQGG